MVETRLIDVDGLQRVVDGLLARGFTVIGPTERAGAIVNAPLTGVHQLPRGRGDEQGPASYRLRPRDDEAFFGFAAAAQSAKPVFFPTDELLWRGRRTAQGRGFEVDRDADAAALDATRPARRPARGAVLRPERARHPRPGAHRARCGRRPLRRAPRRCLRRRGGLLRPGRHLLLRLDGHRAAARARPWRTVRPVPDRAARGRPPVRRRGRQRPGRRAARRGRGTAGAGGGRRGRGRGHRAGDPPDGAPARHRTASRSCSTPAWTARGGTTSPLAACPAPTARWCAPPASARRSRTSPT